MAKLVQPVRVPNHILLIQKLDSITINVEGATKRALGVFSDIARVDIPQKHCEEVQLAMNALLVRIGTRRFKTSHAKSLLRQASQALAEQKQLKPTAAAEIIDDGMGGATEGMVKTDQTWTNGAAPVDLSDHAMHQG